MMIWNMTNNLKNLADDIDSSRQYSQHTDAARIHNEKSNRLLTNMKTKTVFKKKEIIMEKIKQCKIECRAIEKELTELAIMIDDVANCFYILKSLFRKLSKRGKSLVGEIPSIMISLLGRLPGIPEKDRIGDIVRLIALFFISGPLKLVKGMGVVLIEQILFRILQAGVNAVGDINNILELASDVLIDILNAGGYKVIKLAESVKRTMKSQLTSTVFTANPFRDNIKMTLDGQKTFIENNFIEIINKDYNSKIELGKEYSNNLYSAFKDILKKLDESKELYIDIATKSLNYDKSSKLILSLLNKKPSYIYDLLYNIYMIHELKIEDYVEYDWIKNNYTLELISSIDSEILMYGLKEIVLGENQYKIKDNIYPDGGPYLLQKKVFIKDKELNKYKMLLDIKEKLKLDIENKNNFLTLKKSPDNIDKAEVKLIEIFKDKLNNAQSEDNQIYNKFKNYTIGHIITEILSTLRSNIKSKAVRGIRDIYQDINLYEDKETVERYSLLERSNSNILPLLYYLIQKSISMLNISSDYKLINKENKNYIFFFEKLKISKDSSQNYGWKYYDIELTNDIQYLSENIDEWIESAKGTRIKNELLKRILGNPLPHTSLKDKGLLSKTIGREDQKYKTEVEKINEEKGYVPYYGSEIINIIQRGGGNKINFEDLKEKAYEFAQFKILSVENIDDNKLLNSIKAARKDNCGFKK